MLNTCANPAAPEEPATPLNPCKIFACDC